MTEKQQSVMWEILGAPIAWKRPGRKGKIYYDTQKKEKEMMQWHLKSQFKLLFPACTAIRLVVQYHMPIPKSYSKRRALECLDKPHRCKPDLSNLVKFTEDTFTGFLWEDDALISEIMAQKFYSPEPKTVLRIEPMSSEFLTGEFQIPQRRSHHKERRV